MSTTRKTEEPKKPSTTVAIIDKFKIELVASPSAPLAAERKELRTASQDLDDYGLKKAFGIETVSKRNPYELTEEFKRLQLDAQRSRDAVSISITPEDHTNKNPLFSKFKFGGCME